MRRLAALVAIAAGAPDRARPGDRGLPQAGDRPAGGLYDIGTKPRSQAAYRRFIVPLSR